ncbi:MAG: NTP transferase domain-containing protein [Azospirillum sp.]|nr:NTP transferase domain-containing protein [Azospirillum sp.]
MRALLLAAGLGTRLRPLTERVPKCLVPIHGRPLLGYWLDALLGDRRIERVLINTHYLADAVEAFIATSPWRARVDLVHEPVLLGTGGTILANRRYFGDGDFFVAHADNLTDAAPGRLIDAHRAAGGACWMTLLAFRTATPQTCGILQLDAQQHVVGFHEKVADPPGNLANGAVYVFAPEVLTRIAALARATVDLSTEIIPSLMPHILAVEHGGFFLDIGTPEALAAAQACFPRPG